MTSAATPVRPRIGSGVVAGMAALVAVVAAVGGSLVGLAAGAANLDPTALWRDPYLQGVLRFTLEQAALSTVLSLGFAVPMARALARRDFPGRIWLIRLFGLPLVMPVLSAVLGLLSVFGANGWINRGLEAFGVGRPLDVYGLSGILLAHVFFNMPLAVRLLLQAWARVPDETWRLAAQLGMGSATVFRRIEWPVLRDAAPGIAGLVFMLCIVSFTTVFVLGGGPASTTLEVAIYQALRFDFDPGRAALLALWQLALTLGLIGLAQGAIKPMAAEPSLRRPMPRPDVNSLAGRVGDGLVIALGGLVVVLPLAAVVEGGLAGPFFGLLAEAEVWQALARSLAIAAAAATLAVTLALALLAWARRLRRQRRNRLVDAVEASGQVVLVVPPFVLGAGWFMLLRHVGDVFALGPIVVVAVNALMVLPYVLRVLGPALARVDADYDRLCANLGLAGLHRLRRVDGPLARGPIGFALALGLALSLGDLGAIALFGTQDTATLPLLLYQRLGNYRVAEAASLSLWLAIVCLLLFVVVERLVGGRGRR